MKVVRMLLRILGVLGALLLTVFTLAVSAVNMAMVTPYWVMVVGGGTALFLVVALLAGGLARLAWKTPARKGAKLPVIIACVFLIQAPLHFLFNAGCAFAVRSYLEGQVPKLEAYHQAQESYPGSLDEIVKGGGAMPLLAGQWSAYSVYNERSSFRLSVQHPIATGQYVYDAQTKAWETRK